MASQHIQQRQNRQQNDPIETNTFRYLNLRKGPTLQIK
jgi:hypothetical protein